jgi:formiminotetrahydrofolate cyclodeaminase
VPDLDLTAALDVSGALAALGDPDSPPAAGSVVALAGAFAASVAVKAARASGDGGAAAQAFALCIRLTKLAARDAEALDLARQALASAGEGGDDRRDFGLGQRLREAAAYVLEIAEACADVAVLSEELAETATPDLQPDCRAAGWLAAAAARGASHLVEVNLAVREDDPLALRARRAAAALPL